MMVLEAADCPHLLYKADYQRWQRERAKLSHTNDYGNHQGRLTEDDRRCVRGEYLVAHRSSHERSIYSTTSPPVCMHNQGRRMHNFMTCQASNILCDGESSPNLCKAGWHRNIVDSLSLQQISRDCDKQIQPSRLLYISYSTTAGQAASQSLPLTLQPRRSEPQN